MTISVSPRPFGLVTMALSNARRVLVGEKHRWAHWAPIFLGLGIGLYFALPNEPPVWPAAVIAFAGMAGLGHWRQDALGRAAMSGVLLIGLGLGLAQWRAHSVAAPVLERSTGPVGIRAVVEKVEPFHDGSARVTVSRPEFDRFRDIAPIRKARVRIRPDNPAIVPGATIDGLAVLLPPSRPMFPGGYDFARRAWFEGLGGVGYSLGGFDVVEAPPERGGAPAIEVWRERIARNLAGENPDASRAVAVALMTGHRGYIPDDTVTALRDAGLAHLLAISGLHIGLIAGLVFFGLRALMALSPSLTLHYPIKKWAAAGAMLAAFGYLLISGATVPTQRAFIMTSIVLLAIMLDRPAISMRPVAVAAFVILVTAPESLLSPSFQLSFAAVVGLVAAYEALRAHRRPGRRGAWPKRLALYLGGVLLTTIIAEAAIGPFAAYHFHRAVAYGLSANMIAVPLMAFWVMPWAVIAFLLLPFGWAEIGLTPMMWGIDAIIRVAEQVTSWPHAVIGVKAGPPAAIALIALGGLWLCLWHHRTRLFGLAGIAAGAVIWSATPTPDLLINDNARLIAVKGGDGRLYFDTTRAERRSGEAWRESLGDTESARGWEQMAQSQLRCDSLGCLYRKSGRLVALISDPAAIADDCAVADLIVSREPVRMSCARGQPVIDRFDVWREGSHAVYLRRSEIEIVSSADRQGRRLWSYDRGGGSKRQ